MVQLTTPEQIFTLPTSVGNIAKLLITYEQSGNIILEKNLNDCDVVEENVVSFTLTQEETKMFAVGAYGIQVRILTKEGKALASEPIERICKRVFNDDILEA